MYKIMKIAYCTKDDVPFLIFIDHDMYRVRLDIKVLFILHTSSGTVLGCINLFITTITVTGQPEFSKLVRSFHRHTVLMFLILFMSIVDLINISKVYLHVLTTL